MSVERAAAFGELAGKYASLKWALVHCAGKKPLGKAWQTAQPEAPELVAGKWLQYGQRWNLGVVCGPSAVAVLDVDRDDDPDAACLGLLGLDELPDTPIVRTGKGRLQVYYRDPGGLEKKTRDGFELRVGPHQCLAPPSVHPDTGRAYEWVPDRAPWEVELADLPAHVIEFFAASTNGNHAAAGPIGDVISIGEIDTTLASLAGSMRKRGMSEDAIYVALVEELNRCETGHTHTPKDCRRIAKSIAKKEPAEASARTKPVGSGDRFASDADQPRPLKTISASDVEMRSIEWLDKPLLQGSAFHLLAGAKGVGKGTLVARIAAGMTRGVYGPARNVLMVSSEDSDSIDTVPRLVAAGADLARVHLVRDHLVLPRDLYRLEDKAREIGNVGQVVIDPLSNHIGDTDTNAEGAVRHAIQGLNALADELACLVLGIRHVGKSRDRGALAAVLGSTAWVDLPRAVLMFARDDEDEMVFHVQVVAGNRSGRTTAESFRIELRDVAGLKEPVTCAVALGESLKSVDDLLAAPRRASKSVSARELLLDILDAEGEQESDALDARVAAETGLAAKTIKNQRTELGKAGLIRSVPEKDENGHPARWLVARTGAPR